jgi:Rrf2 family iron-sulfur cluster assembly transcriptional regulator
MLELLHQSPLKIGVLSSDSPAYVEEFLRYYDLMPWVHGWQGTGPGQPSKPDPTLLGEMCDRLQVSVARTLIVGDSWADLALAEAVPGHGEELMSLAAVAKRQDISLPYLEQLFVKLRRAGLVEAVRGPGGGYRLAKSADAIRISEVMEAVEETVDALHTGAGASGGVSGSRAQSLTNRLWEGLSANVYVFLHQTRLSDVIRNEMQPCPAVPALFRVVDEE